MYAFVNVQKYPILRAAAQSLLDPQLPAQYSLQGLDALVHGSSQIQKKFVQGDCDIRFEMGVKIRF